MENRQVPEITIRITEVICPNCHRNVREKVTMLGDEVTCNCGEELYIPDDVPIQTE